jgi:putative oxidoreductase
MNINTVSTIMRVLLGIIFTAHGISKLQMGVSNVAGWFGSIGIPEFAAYIVVFLELIGGIALIIGFATRYFSLALIIVLLGAIVTVKLPVGLLGNAQMAGYELDLALIALAAYFAFAKERGFGLDQLLFKNK